MVSEVAIDGMADFFFASPRGQRFRENASAVVTHSLLDPAQGLSVLLQDAGLGNGARVRVINPTSDFFRDSGRWCDPRLVGGPSIQLELLFTQGRRPSARQTRSMFGPMVDVWPTPRVRTLDHAHDIEKLAGQVDLVVFSANCLFYRCGTDELVPVLNTLAVSSTAVAVGVAPGILYCLLAAAMARGGVALRSISLRSSTFRTWVGRVPHGAELTGFRGVISNNSTDDVEGIVSVTTEEPITTLPSGDPGFAWVRGGPARVLIDDEVVVLLPDGEEVRTGCPTLAALSDSPIAIGEVVLRHQEAHVAKRLSAPEAKRTMLQEAGISIPRHDDLSTHGLFGIVVRDDAGLWRRYMRTRGPLAVRDPLRRTALHYASILDRRACAHALLVFGADPNAVDVHGWTPLAYAAALGATEIAEMLVEAGADRSRVLVPGIAIKALLSADAPLGGSLPPKGSGAPEQPIPADAVATSEHPEAAAAHGSRVLAGMIANALGRRSAAEVHGALPLSLGDVAIPPPRIRDIDLAPSSGSHAPRVEPQALTAAEAPIEPGPAPAPDAASSTSYSQHAPDPVRWQVREGVSNGQSAPRTAAPAARRGAVTPVFSWVAELNADDAANKARDVAVRWMQQRCGCALDPLLPAAETPVASVISDVSPDGKLWAARLDDTRTQSAIWRVEVVIAGAAGRVFAAVRLVAIQPADADASISPSVPTIVRDLAALGARDNGVPLDRVVSARTNEDGLRLVAQLTDPARHQPMLVITRRRGDARVPSVPAGLSGACSVVELAGDAVQVLIDAWGRELSVFAGAWRVYRPGFEGADADPHASPLLIDAPTLAPGNLRRVLVKALSTMTRTRIGDADAVPGFLTARTLIAEARQRAPVPVADIEANKALIESLRRDVATWRDLAEDPTREQEIESLRQERDGLRDELAHMRRQATSLRLALEQRREAAGRGVEYPTSFEDLEAWSAEVLGEAVVIAPRALRAARSAVSDAATIELAYRCLHMLAVEYLDMKLGDDAAARKVYEDRCAELRVSVGPVGAATNNHRYRDSYKVSLGGKTRMLDMHVSGSSSRDVRKQLRIYFLFDPDECRVVVGHLPEHLDNTLT